ncbi:MAG: D-glycerate dehydrogenase [Syntrophorhabdaceae bacterium]|nr:D-glycerate dehydrogenase [Syntrophorhabdaceae bacterium]
MRPKVYIARRIPFPHIEEIGRYCDVVTHEGDESPSRDELIKNLRDKDGILCLVADRMDREAIDAAPYLKVISTMSVGYEHIDIAYATEKGIYVGYTPDVLTEATADLAFSLLLATARHIAFGDRYIREGRWRISWSPTFLLGRSVWGATLGIIGMGRIGKAVAKRAGGFNMRVIYNDLVRLAPEEEEEMGVEYVSFDTLLEGADFISLHVPVTDKTRHMINEESLKKVKSTAIIINTSRGAIVDEEALVKALKEGWMAGAGLDVFEKEPIPPESGLIGLDNVVLVPHIGSATFEARTRMAELAAKNLLSVLKGEKPPCLVNPDVMAIRPLSQVKMI